MRNGMFISIRYHTSPKGLEPLVPTDPFTCAELLDSTNSVELNARCSQGAPIIGKALIDSDVFHGAKLYAAYGRNKGYIASRGWSLGGPVSNPNKNSDLAWPHSRSLL